MPSSKNACSDQAKPPGVLFVHGIGEQSRGETLTAFGDALHRWYCRWFSRNGTDDEGVELVNTVIEPSSNDPAAPAHTWLRFTGNAPAAATCLLAESHWAATFTTPTFGEVARWALVALPWTIVVQFAASLREMAAEYGGSLRNYPQMILGVFFFVMALYLGALTQLLVLLILVLAAVPIPALRRFFIALELKIAAIIGDCYILLESPIRSSAITSRVQRDLEWLSRQCGCIAIVAHSQGAAVTHQVLTSLERNSDPIASHVSLFFSLGSGLGKLHDVREAMKPGTYTKWLGPFVTAALTIASVSLPGVLLDMTRRTDLREMPPLITLIAVFASFAMVFTLAILSDWSETHRRKLLSGEPAHGFRWVDRYATADPVPSGPLLKNDPRGDRQDSREQSVIDSAPVHNRHALLSDHTSYLRNEDEFVTTLAVELASSMGIPMDRMPCAQTVHDASRRRRWRVKWLAAVRRLTAAAFLFTVWALREELAGVGTWVGMQLAATWKNLPDGMLDGWIASVVAMTKKIESPRLFGAFVVAVSFFVWYEIVLQIWLWWNRWDTARLFERRRQDFGGPPFILLLTLAVLTPLGIFLLWAAGVHWASVLAVFETVWTSRTAVGYALGSWLCFAPLCGFLLAILPRFQVPNEQHGTDLDMWTFGMFAAAIAIVSLPAMIWSSVVFPEPFKEIFFPSSSASGLKQLATIAAAVGPPLVAAALVGFFTATLGQRLGEFFRVQSLSPDRPIRPRPPHQIGILSCVAGGASVLVSVFLDPRDLSAPGVLTIVVLWLVSGLASVNAMARGEERSLADRLAYVGVGLMMLSLVIHAR